VTYGYEESNSFKVMKAACDNESFAPGWITAKYTPGTKWLTDVPNNTMLVSRKYPFWASILNTEVFAGILVRAYDAADNHIATFSGDIEDQPEKIDIFIDLNLPYFTEELEPQTPADVARLEMTLDSSEILHVLFVDEECGEFHQLSWINNIGTYDQFLFSHNRDTESAISMQEYKKQFGQWNSSNQFEYDSLTSGDTTYVKTNQPTGTIYSGWISEAYQNWLNNIYFSIDTWLYSAKGDNTPTLEKITVTDTKAVNDKERFTDILNFQVNYKKTNFKSITS